MEDIVNDQIGWKDCGTWHWPTQDALNNAIEAMIEGYRAHNADADYIVVQSFAMTDVICSSQSFFEQRVERRFAEAGFPNRRFKGVYADSSGRAGDAIRRIGQENEPASVHSCSIGTNPTVIGSFGQCRITLEGTSAYKVEIEDSS